MPTGKDNAGNTMHRDIRINYPPRFAVRWGVEGGGARHVRSILDARRTEQANFIAEMGRFSQNFLDIPIETTDSRSPCWKQDWFPPLDGMSSYTMVASVKPQHLLEIGSGNSTKFFAKAKHDYSPRTTISSIDPEPREEVDALCDSIHRTRLEDIDLRLFENLVTDDVLFFDGSHRSFQNSDVTTFFIDVLPSLAEGVIVGIHDIFWPFDYPKAWINRFYNEQYLLAAYMVPFGSAFPLIFSSCYAAHYMQAEIDTNIQSEVKAVLPPLKGGCFWFRKTSLGGFI